MAETFDDYASLLGGTAGFGGFLSSVGGIAGGIVGANSASSSKRWTNYWNQLNYDLSRASLYSGKQIAVDDLKRAGLNPVLAATQGQGASGGGFSAQQVPSIADGLSKGVQAAASAMQLKQLDADIDKTKADTRYADMAAVNQGAQATQASAMIRKLKADAAISEYGASSAKAESDFWRALDKSGSDAKALTFLKSLVK